MVVAKQDILSQLMENVTIVEELITVKLVTLTYIVKLVKITIYLQMEPVNQSVETIVLLAHGQVNVPTALIIIPTFPVLVFLVMSNSVKFVIKKIIVRTVFKDTNQ